MAKKKVVLKKLIIESDEAGEFTVGVVQYGLKYGNVLFPKHYTLGTPNWFEPADLKKILKRTKEQIELSENITN